MKSLKKVILLIFVLVCVVIFPYIFMHNFFKPTPATTLPGGDFLCGPKSLLVVCQILGVPASLSELTQFCETTQKGTSIRQLVDAAEKKGMDAQAKRVSFDKLRQISLPAIALVERSQNHFLVVDCVSDDAVTVIDPPVFHKEIPMNEWLSQWKGTVITFEVQNWSGIGPQIRFEYARARFEDIADAQPVEHVFRYHNIGNQPLKINQIEPSCQCTVAFSSEEAILPNETGEIKVIYVPNGAGYFDYHVKLRSNDPRRPLSILTLQGTVRAIPKPSPSRLHFSDFDHPKILRIISPSAEPAKLLKIDIDSTLLRVKTVEESEVLAFEVSIVSSRLSDEVRTKVGIYIDHPDISQIEVPVTYNPQRAIKVYPRRLFLGSIYPAEEKEYNVMLKASERKFAISKIVSQSSFLLGTVEREGKSAEHKLRIKVSESVTKGPLRDTLKIHTTHPAHQEIEIPVSGIVMNR